MGGHARARNGNRNFLIVRNTPRKAARQSDPIANPVSVKPVPAPATPAITAKDILANAAKPVSAKPAKPVSVKPAKPVAAKPAPTPREQRRAVSAKLAKRANAKRERATERKPEPTP